MIYMVMCSRPIRRAMDDFVLRAALGGILVAVIAGPLGCFVIWRRMAYFGAALSHAALLGIALGILLDMNLHIAVLAVAAAVAFALFALERFPQLASDTVLGIVAHASLALGLVLLSFMDNIRTDLMGYLFGDILAITSADLVRIAVGSGVCLAVLTWGWRALLAITVDAEIAKVEGISVTRYRGLFLLLTTLLVAMAMQVVGLLLTVSMLILPAAAARPLSATPERMAAIAAIAGVIAVGGGLAASLHFDTPAGPSIVVASTALFIMTHLIRARAA